MGENRFEIIADIDVDSAVFQVGLEHYAFGPPRPALMFNTGAVIVSINVHEHDLPDLIEALQEAQRRLARPLPVQNRSSGRGPGTTRNQKATP